MASVGSSPTARRFELSRRLKELRHEAGRSVEDVAEELACSPAKVSRIENGQRVATALDVKVLARYYGLSDRAQTDLVALATEARKRGWWHDYRTLDEQVRTYYGLESAASELHEVEVVRLPGLLQTHEYTKALVPRLRTENYWKSHAYYEEIIASRQRRFERVLSGDLRVGMVIDEAALLRRLGPPTLMIHQVRHLIELAGLSNVTLRMTTFDVGSHPGMDEPFTVLTFADDSLHDTVFVEGLAGNHIIKADDKPEIVAQFLDAYRHISEDVALAPEETLTWLERFLAERGDGPLADPR